MKILGYNLSKETPKTETVKLKVPSASEAMEFAKFEIPVLSERIVRNEYVDYDDPRYPWKLVNYLNESSLHNRIVLSKANLVAGGDILIDGVPYSEWILTASSGQSIILNSFMENGYYDDLDIVKGQIAIDLEISGNYYLEIIWSRDFSRIAGYKYHPWTKVRPGPKNEWGQIPYYMYSEDFTRSNSKKIEIEAFDPLAHSPNGVSETELESWGFSHNQMMMVKTSWPYLDYFGRPQYYGGILDIEATTFISKYNINSIQNGFSPSIMITMEEPESQEEKMKIGRNIENQFGGIGRKIALFFKRGDIKPEFQPIEVKNLSDQYLALQDKTTQSILTAHGITSPEIFGVQVAGKLGSAELDVAWSIYFNQIILPNKRMLEKTFNTLLKLNGFEGKIEFEVKKPWDSLSDQNNQVK